MVYHVLNRAVRREPLFKRDADYEAFERVLEEAHDREPIRILSYCLMPNHWHLVVWPRLEHDDQVSEFMRWLTLTHAQRWHAHFKTTGTGPIYQGRFKAFPVQDDKHLWTVLRYVERNPVRARLMRLAWRYPWSSAAAHCGEADRSGLLDVAAWRRRYNPDAWRAILKQLEDEQMIQRIRSRTFNGRPLAGDRFVAKLEAKLHRRLRPARMGRPSKPKKGR